MDVCLTVPAHTAISDDFGCRKISGGHYAAIEMEAQMQDCYQAWEIVFNEWLPEIG
ncbi:effector binding domain-containing protein [Undibacterium curvum]|uniref:effector binding domain-containing protein n=1 Tax=Undibacterium curvum TaxID=2762294 RepID=UPI003D0D54D0